jgi:hypothetical protein
MDCLVLRTSRYKEEAVSDYERIAREALERAEKATDGPWAPDLDVSDADDPEIEAGVISDNLTVWFTSGTEIMCKEQGDWERARASQAYKDAEFIAHARQDVPDLARAVLDLQRQLRDEKASQSGSSDATRGNN